VETRRGGYRRYHIDVLRSDLDLARDLLAGNSEAFEEFVQSFRARLAHYTWLMCGQREDAEEVAQETLIRVFESIDQLREPARLKAWVFRIARNECLMKRRKSIFAPSVELSLDELKPNRLDDRRGIEIADWSALPVDLLLHSELRDALTAGIRALPEIYRSVVLLRDVEELSTDETAEILDISSDTVKTRLHRGRLALRKSLDAYLRSRERSS
jgi:RNA polymerase sigma-70 factor (ECF subfamily)